MTVKPFQVYDFHMLAPKGFITEFLWWTGDFQDTGDNLAEAFEDHLENLSGISLHSFWE